MGGRHAQRFLGREVANGRTGPTGGRDGRGEQEAQTQPLVPYARRRDAVPCVWLRRRHRRCAKIQWISYRPDASQTRCDAMMGRGCLTAVDELCRLRQSPVGIAPLHSCSAARCSLLACLVDAHVRASGLTPTWKRRFVPNPVGGRHQAGDPALAKRRASGVSLMGSAWDGWWYLAQLCRA